MEKDIFNKAALQRYGSLPAFQEAIRRELLIEKFISEKIAPHGIERQAARGAVDRWMEKLYAKSAVRITLSEQWSAASCACCSNRADAAPLSGADSRGNGVSGKGGSPSPAMSAAGKASEAALLYWHEKHGNEEVSTEVKDYGCHMQIDIIKNNKTVGSLQYQGGRISELR